MKYTIDNINVNDDFLFFWGHRPSKDGSIIKSCFSQWWQSPFVIDEIIYKTAEHYMMAQKALLFNDQEIYNLILKEESPIEVKKLGRQIKNYDDPKWADKRYGLVLKGNIHKFEQNSELKDFIISTGTSIIVEASPVDNISKN